jgi:hypothetical protein
MTLTFDWFLPTSGDGRTIYGRGHSLPIAQAQALPIPGDWPPDIEYLGQVARAAEQVGFAAVLRHLGVHPVRVPAPGGGVLVRRGRAARAAPARPLGG